ncbi:MAG TPA: prepilin-type N-terminal cleavage/methylation domain-containing protein [Candidatus Binatia bacterium]|jgi:Tfp pilus assembly protein PilV
MRNQNNLGFTLVEILVSVLIFSFAVLGLAIGTVTLTRTNADSHLRASAINVAQARLEELKAMSPAALTALVAACTSISSAGCNDTFSASGITYGRRWWFAANSPIVGVNRIDVKVDWTDHGSRTLTFTAAVPQ